MSFEWDPEKASLNLAKHGISFELARRVWDDPNHQIFDDWVVDGERRYYAVGLVGTMTVIVVVHRHPDEDDDAHIRIISARRASASERRRYEQQTFQP